MNCRNIPQEALLVNVMPAFMETHDLLFVLTEACETHDTVFLNFRIGHTGALDYWVAGEHKDFLLFSCVT
jgi:hypothetical protein